MNSYRKGFLCLFAVGTCICADVSKPDTTDQLLAMATSFEISLVLTRGPKTVDNDWAQMGVQIQNLAAVLQAGSLKKAFQLVDSIYALKQKMPDCHGNISVSLDSNSEKKSNESISKDYICLAYRADKASTSPALWQAMLTLGSFCAKFFGAHPEASYQEFKPHLVQALPVDQ